MKRSPMSSKPRPRKCKAPGCTERFTPQRMGQLACSPACALAVGQKIRLQEERISDKQRKERLITQPQWVAKAQAAFNGYIRARDAGKPCICCGQFPQSYAGSGGEWDAGHFRSRGAAPELRFDERNCHAQMKRCNRRAWDVASYRANLIGRIGLAEVEDLEGPHPPRKWTIDELKALAADYRARTRALKAVE